MYSVEMELNMKSTNKKPKNKHWKASEMMPLYGCAEIDPKTNASMPSEENVKDARDWVDFNKK